MSPEKKTFWFNQFLCVVCVAAAVFRSGEEEESSVWVCHPTGGL